jgi:hypothetical protein
MSHKNATNINNLTPNPSNPSSLPLRFEIRKLDDSHASWASAIISHANTFHSPVWPFLYPSNKSQLHRDIFASLDYLVQHQIDSGLSYGVFDNEYVYKTDEARDVDGKLIWDEKMDQDDSGGQFLKGMDFPLVSVALSFDAISPLDMEKLAPLLTVLPHFGPLGQILSALDSRPPESWNPTGPNQVLQRNATATRRDYEGQGLMSGMARWLMREAYAKGYRGIPIVCLSDAMTHVWSQPESPYKGSVVSKIDMATWKDEDGKATFAPSKQVATKCYVELR